MDVHLTAVGAHMIVSDVEYVDYVAADHGNFVDFSVAVVVDGVVAVAVVDVLVSAYIAVAYVVGDVTYQLNDYKNRRLNFKFIMYDIILMIIYSYYHLYCMFYIKYTHKYTA